MIQKLNVEEPRDGWRQGRRHRRVLAFDGPTARGWYRPCKAGAELAFALCLLALTAPLMLLLGLVVKLTSKGPMFYTQKRLGKDGRPYTIFKIRTMAHNCEHQSGAQWSTPQDPRVTRVGRFLRRTHLDELPQLWNIVRGDMSLIGPRPERPEFVPVLERAIPRYRERLLVRPGVTGLAQVQLPPDTDIDDVRRKTAYDLYYVEWHSPWLDLRILVCTAFHMVGVPYRVLRRVFRMPHPDDVGGTDRVGEAVEVDFHRLQPASTSA